MTVIRYNNTCNHPTYKRDPHKHTFRRVVYIIYIRVPSTHAVTLNYSLRSFNNLFPFLYLLYFIFRRFLCVFTIFFTARMLQHWRVCVWHSFPPLSYNKYYPYYRYWSTVLFLCHLSGAFYFYLCFARFVQPLDRSSGVQTDLAHNVRVLYSERTFLF